MKTRVSIKRIAILALFLSLLIISAYIKIPTAFLPFTLQLLVALIISMIVTQVEGFIIYVTYIIMGLAGIPVFASGGGLGYLYLPSFGFILGFVVMHLVIGITLQLLKNVPSQLLKHFISSAFGLIALYLVGVTYGYLILNIVKSQNYSLTYILNLMVTPFLVFDLFKCIISSIIVSRLKPVLKFRGKNGV